MNGIVRDCGYEDVEVIEERVEIFDWVVVVGREFRREEAERCADSCVHLEALQFSVLTLCV